MTRTIIARLLVLLVVWSLTALFVVLQADRVAGIRLAAAEEDAMESNKNRIKNFIEPKTLDGMLLNHQSWLWNEMHDYAQDYCDNRNIRDGLEIAYFVFEATYETDIDPLLILAIIEQESSFQLRNPKTKDGRGLAGEYGLMQIHPCWVGNDAIGSPTVAELWSIDGNIAAGVAIFKRNYTDDYLAALGAYNTGGGRNKVYENKVDAVYLKLRGEFYFRLTGRR